eukprot:GHVU01176958.1.p1 GENE.GHVU01176958.1~~GHVU01176958.1.p1  ORF type:complete len:107 (+),score=5.47 GHVU01176958.1:289-609(+)
MEERIEGFHFSWIGGYPHLGGYPHFAFMLFELGMKGKGVLVTVRKLGSRFVQDLTSKLGSLRRASPSLPGKKSDSVESDHQVSCPVTSKQSKPTSEEITFVPSDLD